MHVDRGDRFRAEIQTRFSNGRWKTTKGPAYQVINRHDHELSPGQVWDIVVVDVHDGYCRLEAVNFVERNEPDVQFDNEDDETLGVESGSNPFTSSSTSSRNDLLQNGDR